jgi:hypothetical protein
MKINKPKLERAKYMAKYTANTYIDYILSAPLFITENVYKGIGCIEEKLTGKIEFADWKSVKEHTPGYKTRENIREKWDTEHGVNLINSNLAGMVAFLVAGPIVAEATYKGLEQIIPQDSPVIRQLTTSIATSIAGYIAGNGTVIADFTLYRDRKNHLKQDGSIDLKKVYKTGKDMIIAALGFDIPFFGGKILTQTVLINQGMDPAPASLVYDTAGIFAWYTYLIPASLYKSIIKPNPSQDVNTKNHKENIEL